VEPDPGSAAPSRKFRQRLDRRLGTTCQVQDYPDNGQAELGSNSQANMIWRRSHHLDSGGRDIRPIHHLS
jgi:hypothetical protein